MRLLLTGCAGFIGFHTAQKLLSNGCYILGIDNLDDYYCQKLKKNRLELLTNNKNFKFKNCDINKFFIDEKNFDAVIHLAAQPGVRLPKSMHHKYMHANIDGFEHIIDQASKNNIRRFIYASSSSVYSGNTKVPYCESHKLENPTSLYGKTKLNNELFADKFIEKMKIIGLRFFTVYGPWGRPDMAYFSFTKKIKENTEIILYNHGDTQRDMTYIDDISDGILQSLLKVDSIDGHAIFNLGNTKPVNTKYLISLIEERYGKEAKIKYLDIKNEVKITLADITKAQTLINYAPKISIDSGLKLFFDWYDAYYGKM